MLQTVSRFGKFLTYFQPPYEASQFPGIRAPHAPLLKIILFKILTYDVKVSNEHFFLQRSDVGVQEVQPLAVVPDLVHVDVPGRDVLIATLKSSILSRDWSQKLRQYIVQVLLPFPKGH